VEGPLTVPGVAVFADESGQPHVWVVDTDSMTVHKRAVETGRPRGTDSLEVLEGLEPGETIAVSGASRLHEGQPVRRME
jgi:multidrug efflux system membrane fusion protein